ISQDLDELREIADTLSVITQGHLTASVRNGSLTNEEIGLMMGGPAEPQPLKPEMLHAEA
ncbi:MAG: ABC transporter ATP-binding protein, partial [Pseudomonadota bacterium]